MNFISKLFKNKSKNQPEPLPESRATFPENPVCDVCGRPLDLDKAFILSTDQVVTNKSYWEFFYNKQNFSVVDPAGASVINNIGQLSGQTTGWAICESCSSMFVFDHSVAHNYALQRKAIIPLGKNENEWKQKALAVALITWKNMFRDFPISILIHRKSLGDFLNIQIEFPLITPYLSKVKSYYKLSTSTETTLKEMARTDADSIAGSDFFREMLSAVKMTEFLEISCDGCSKKLPHKSFNTDFSDGVVVISGKEFQLSNLKECPFCNYSYARIRMIENPFFQFISEEYLYELSGQSKG